LAEIILFDEPRRREVREGRREEKRRAESKKKIVGATLLKGRVRPRAETAAWMKIFLLSAFDY
jgi:hypothetical protein